MQASHHNMPESTTWVFGYGSLIWRQDFPYIQSRCAYIEGYGRRFWQGSHDHRGRADAPGRVVTLMKRPGERCFGRAFLVEPAVFEHLDHREKNGYQRYELRICFDDSAAPGVTYVAPHDNHAFLGPAPLAEMIEQIRGASGESGANIEYVVELARALREHNIVDPHVFEIEQALTGSMGECSS